MPDPLFPWLYELDTCPSTNTWALNRIRDLPHSAVVFTSRQTQGRGQRGRSWYGPPGCLTASVVLKGVASLAGLSLAAGLAVIYAVEDLLPDCRDQLQLKWPNDVLVNRRKLAGVLCEAAAQQSVVVGIGLNRCVDFTSADASATGFVEAANRAISLHQLTDSVPDELALLQQLRHYLLEVADLFSQPDAARLQARSNRPMGLEVLLPVLRQRDALLHQPIRLSLPQEVLSGTAVGIDSSGQLLLQTEQGLRAVGSGRVSWGDQQAGGDGKVGDFL